MNLSLAVVVSDKGRLVMRVNAVVSEALGVFQNLGELEISGDEAVAFLVGLGKTVNGDSSGFILNADRDASFTLPKIEQTPKCSLCGNLDVTPSLPHAHSFTVGEGILPEFNLQSANGH